MLGGYSVSLGVRREAKMKSEVERIREGIANIHFCWDTCGEIALTCQKQQTCAAFGDRHNESYGHPQLDYRKADQILKLIELEIREILAKQIMKIEKFDSRKEVGRVPLARGDNGEKFVMSVLADGSGIVLEFEHNEAYFLATQELVAELLNRREYVIQ